MCQYIHVRVNRLTTLVFLRALVSSFLLMFATMARLYMNSCSVPVAYAVTCLVNVVVVVVVVSLAGAGWYIPANSNLCFDLEIVKEG